MRRLLYLLPVLFLACATSVPVVAPPVAPPGTPFHIYNSAWEIIGEGVKPASKDLALGGWADIVAAYNADHTDDQYMMADGEVIPIELAPPAVAYIVKASDYSVIKTFEDVSRVALRDERPLWRLECMADNGILFVDKVPPPPIPPEPIDPFIQYACYVLDDLGVIQFEAHPTAEEYTAIANAYRLEALAHLGWQFITGRLYP